MSTITVASALRLIEDRAQAVLDGRYDGRPYSAETLREALTGIRDLAQTRDPESAEVKL